MLQEIIEEENNIGLRNIFIEQRINNKQLAMEIISSLWMQKVRYANRSYAYKWTPADYTNLLSQYIDI